MYANIGDIKRVLRTRVPLLVRLNVWIQCILSDVEASILELKTQAVNLVWMKRELPGGKPSQHTAIVVCDEVHPLG